MKKIKIILIITTIISLIIGVISYAANTYKVEMYSLGSKFLVGETINISVKVENIEVEDGIVAYSTMLSYDNNIFEEPTITNAVNWTKPTIVENLIQSTTQNIQPINESQEIMTLSFKIKEKAKVGKTKISLNKFEISNGESTIGNEGAEVEFEIADTKTEITNVLIDSGWFNLRNVVISLIIGMVTMIIIVVLTIYYLERRNRIEKASMLYEEVKGIVEEKGENEDKSTKENNKTEEKG